MLDLRRLRAFVTVAEEGHVTRAAERLGIAQPPLSRLLRALEEELGTRLLHRMSRGVRPTEAGLALLAEGRRLLAEAETLPLLVQGAARGELGRLAIGFTGSAVLHPFVPAALRAFRTERPGVQLALEEGGTGELVEAIGRSRLDAAFVRSRIAVVGGLRIEPLLSEPMVAALPAGHDLAAATGPLRLAELARAPFVLYRRPSGPGLHDAILAACLTAGFTPIVAQEAPRLTSTLGLVAAGIGVSVVPRSMARLNVETIAYRPLTCCPGLAAPLLLVARRGGGSPAAARFGAMARAMAGLHPRRLDAAAEPGHDPAPQ